MIVLSILMLVLILMIGGIAVDMVRHEMLRSRLQGTLDTAVLAASDLEQSQDPQVVVENYFDAAGLRSYLQPIEVNEGLNFREVTISASGVINTTLMHLSGIDQLTVAATAGGEERKPKVEISLVVDVSGSMNNNDRLANLKTAANEFIDTMLAQSKDSNISISIIPYAAQVGMPLSVFDTIKSVGANRYSGCINFKYDDYDSIALDLSKTYDRTLHFGWYRKYELRPLGQPLGGRDAPAGNWTECPLNRTMSATLYQEKISILQSTINSLKAAGNTAVEIGLKWGLASLDPTFQPIIQAMANSGEIPTAFQDRPLAYDADGVMKVLVLMTDGHNTSTRWLEDVYRSGYSNVFYHPGRNLYSVYVPEKYGRYKYWRPHVQRWTRKPIRGSESVRLTYRQLWEMTSMNYVFQEIYTWLSEKDARRWPSGTHLRGTTKTTKDNRAKKLCDQAHQSNIVLYTISFEATTDGKELMHYCASSPSHYFDVQGLEIKSAFQAIGSSIQNLRLTK